MNLVFTVDSIAAVPGSLPSYWLYTLTLQPSLTPYVSKPTSITVTDRADRFQLGQQYTFSLTGGTLVQHSPVPPADGTVLHV